MGHNGCDGSQASGPWAIGSGYRFSGGTDVLSRGRGGAEGGGHVPTLCGAQAKAVGGREERVHVVHPTVGVAGAGANVGDQQDVRQT